MISQNHVILTGRVAKPPLRHYRPDGSPVVHFPLEFNHEEDASGEGNKGRVDIVATGKLAELESSFFAYGQFLRVEGRLRQRRWQTPEGRDLIRVEVIATDFKKIE